MCIIKNIVFDLGGVVLALSYEQAVKRFEEIGLKDARQRLDAFEQKGIFGDLESGRISAEDFRRELSLLIGRELTMEECYTAWHGYVDYVPKRNLEALLSLRKRGYKVFLLSNTNPFMMQWADKDFDGEGHPISYYFDALYWATVTLTTVGYGDMIPVTNLGRFVSMLSSLFGVAVIALPSGVITASYLDELRAMRKMGIPTDDEPRKNDNNQNQ